MKFKVGDKVRVRKDLVLNHTYGNYFFVSIMEKFKGKIVTIISVCNNRYEIEEDNKRCYWTDEMFEPAVTNFTKADLVDGMVVEFTNGKKAMLVGDRFIGMDCFSKTNSWSNTLEQNSDTSPFKTITKVYKPRSLFLNKYFEDYNLELIWERPKEEPIKEMTVAEIEKELGYKVKMKSED